MGKSSRIKPPKPCHACQSASETVLFRVRRSAKEPWQLLCKTCQTALKDDNKTYEYGGTWKLHKRN